MSPPRISPELCDRAVLLLQRLQRPKGCEVCRRRGNHANGCELGLVLRGLQQLAERTVSVARAADLLGVCRHRLAELCDLGIVRHTVRASARGSERRISFREVDRLRREGAALPDPCEHTNYTHLGTRTRSDSRRLSREDAQTRQEAPSCPR